MAIAAKKTTEGTDFVKKLFTGVAHLKVVGINPSQEELKKLGFKAENAPVYKNDTYRFITFYLQFTVDKQNYITKHTVLTQNKVREGLFIDKFGRFGKDRTKLDIESSREAYIGEIELNSFLQAWADIRKGEELRVDSMKAVVESGDVSELRKYWKAITDNMVQGFLYVSKDGKYQQVFGNKFEKSYSKSYEYLHKELNKQESFVEGDFGGLNFSTFNPDDFKLKEYIPSETKKEEEPVASTASADNDDAPF